MKVDVTTFEAGTAGSVELSDDVFGLEPRTDLLQRVVRWQLAKRQQGTHKAKGRSEIAGTGAKFGRQKGSGRARHGNKKAPLFRSGGRAHGPQPRSHAHDLPKRVRALGLKHALSAKAKAGQLTIVDSLAGDGKTATLKGQFAGLGLNNALIIGGAELDQGFVRAARNLPLIDVLPSQGANVYDILRRDQLVLSKDAVEALEARLK